MTVGWVGGWVGGWVAGWVPIEIKDQQRLINYHKSGDLVASSEYKEVKAVEPIVTCDVNMRSCHVIQGSFS